MARSQGAEVIDFEKEDPVRTLLELTGGIGVDRAIDAVGVDAVHAHHGSGAAGADKQCAFEQERDRIAPDRPPGPGCQAGDAPNKVLDWAVDSLAKAGTLTIIGVCPARKARPRFPSAKS